MNQNQILRRLSCAEINNYNFIKMLGTGSYSEVFQGRCRTDGTETAIKVIDKVFMQKNNKQHQIYLEQEALASIDHPGVIKCYASYESSTKLYLSLELMNDGTLRDQMKTSTLSLGEIKSYIAQIVAILEQIHQKGIVHRDLKPENLMLTKSGFLKLIDFGGIMKFQGELAAKEEPNIKYCRKSSFVGTAQYISPELLDQNMCGPQADLWALGCTAYELITGKTPFQDEVEYLMFQKISDVEPDFTGIDESAADFIRLLLKKDPNERLVEDMADGFRYKQLRNHKFLEGVDWEGLWQERKPEFQRKPVNHAPKQQQSRAQTLIQIGKEVIHSGIVDKEHGMLMFTKFTPRKMQLIRTHFNHELVYYNPYKKKQHQIDLLNAVCELQGTDKFMIHSRNRSYVFRQREHPATQWVSWIKQSIEFNKQFSN